MNKWLHKFSLSSLSIVMLAGIAAGCETKSADSNDTKSSVDGELAVAPANTYPLKTDVTLKIWMPMSRDITTLVPDFGATPFMKELQKRTGVKLQFIHPAIGSEKDQFNIMIASGDLPDIIVNNMGGYPGGASAAEKDGVIIALNDTISKYAPNLASMLKKDKELDKMVKTDDGKYYFFPGVRSELGKVWAGPVLRGDWLKELNLPLPETMDDWHTVLTAFKEKKGATAAFGFEGKLGPSLLRSVFLGAYKTDYGWYVDDNGKVQFGPATQEYKEFLTTFSKWYKEGLIDKDFPLADSNKLKSLIDQNKTGAIDGQSGGYIRTLLDKYKTTDPNFDLVGAKYPVLQKGDVPFIGQKDFTFNNLYSSVISAKSKNVEVAAKFLDYLYSPEGIMFSNFGMENVTYKLDNGKPKFIPDFLTKNPDGLSSLQVQFMYTSNNGLPAVQMGEQVEQLLVYKQQADALKLWSQTESEKHAFPIVSQTDEEAKLFAKYNADLTTYTDTMFTKFVFGAESLDGYDKYVEYMKSTFALDKLIQTQQAAYDRYKKR